MSDRMQLDEYGGHADISTEREPYPTDMEAKKILTKSYGIDADAFTVETRGARILVINPVHPFDAVFRDKRRLDNIRHDIIGHHDDVVAYLTSDSLPPNFVRL